MTASPDPSARSSPLAAAAGPLSTGQLEALDAYWRAANYLSVGQIYLLDNPLLREPLRPEHIKPRLLGHWGTTPGLNFIYAHLNRVIRERDLNAIYVDRARPRRPGHGRQHLPRGHLQRGLPAHRPRRARACAAVPPVLVPRRHPQPRRARDARARSTRAASSATRSPTPTAPRSTTPTCSSCCVVGDGEAETGPLAASWHSNKFLDPGARRRGAADPAPQRLQDRQPHRAGADPPRTSCVACSRATATRPIFVDGRRPGRRCTG